MIAQAIINLGYKGAFAVYEGGIIDWQDGKPDNITEDAILAETNKLEAAYVKATQVKLINEAYETAITSAYSDSEKLSWTKQEAEARAFTADATAPTPMLTAIATARGITVKALAADVILKADAYAAHAGTQIGTKKARLTAIEAATTSAEVLAVVW